MPEYRDIEGFPGYRVGDDGTVWSRKNSSNKGTWKDKPIQWKQLKPGMGSGGYRFVILRNEGKSFNKMIHTLIAYAFVGKRPDGYFICHNDGNKLNNAASNLRYDEPRNNDLDKHKHGTMKNAKLTEEKVLELRKKASQGISRANLAEEFEISKCHVDVVVGGRVWSHLPVMMTDAMLESRKRHSVKLEPEQVKKIYLRRKAGESREEIAIEYGVFPQTITQITNGTCWKEITRLL